MVIQVVHCRTAKARTLESHPARQQPQTYHYPIAKSRPKGHDTDDADKTTNYHTEHTKEDYANSITGGVLAGRNVTHGQPC